MKKITLLLSVLILTSCTAGKDFVSGLKGYKIDASNWGKNPCYNKEKKRVELGCKKK
jgi:hypothetical protein|tara:strand:- start:313 stop:483 length:171 start_codon:yes stop_codon:yes gene_type:complete